MAFDGVKDGFASIKLEIIAEEYSYVSAPKVFAIFSPPKLKREVDSHDANDKQPTNLGEASESHDAQALTPTNLEISVTYS